MNAFARLTAAAVFFLLIAGGLVTSTGSGLAVPDWPLAFGKFFPLMVGGVLFEHGHRLIAGAVALMTFALAALVHRGEKRAWVKNLGYAACGAILIQALLGGMTVLFKLPPPVSIAHACLAQAVFCLILAISQASTSWYLQASPISAGNISRAGLWCVGAVYLQLIFGAMVRHTGQGLSFHLLGAAAAAFLIAAAVYKTFRNFPYEAALTRPAGLLAGLLPLQLLLGLIAFQIRRSPIESGFGQAAVLRTSHLAVGALVLGTSLILTLRAHRLS